MATIVYDSVTYTVKYVDPIDKPAGDGSTVATALSTLPSALTNYTCYLIRRSTDADNLGVQIQATRNSGKTHIMFLGMPKEDSDLYSQVEQDAKTAWGNDSGKYARVRCNCPAGANSNTSTNYVPFYENSIKMLYCENCYFFRDDKDSGGVNTLSANGYHYPMFYFDSDNATDRKLIWKNCKFSYAQYELENDDWLNSNSTIYSDSSTYPQNKCNAYLDCYSANTICFKNCIFNSVESNAQPYYDNYYYSQCHGGVLLRRRCRNFILEDSQINRLPFNHNGSYNDYTFYAPFCIEYNGPEWSTNDFATRATIRNNEFNYILFTGRTNYYSPWMLTCQSCDVLFQNNTFKLKRMSGYNTSSYNCYSDAWKPTFYFNWNRTSLKIDGLKCDMSNNSYIKLSSWPILWCENMVPCCMSTPSDYVRNIDIRFPSSPNRYVGQDILRFNRNTSSTYNSNTNSTNGYITDGYFNQINEFLCENIYIDAQAHTAYGVSLTRTGMKTDTLHCKIYLNNAVAQVNTLYSDRPASPPAVHEGNNSYLKVDNFIVDLTRYTGVRQIQTDALSSAYITTSNVMPYDENAVSTGHIYGSNINMVCLNTIESGQFFARNASTFAKSWSTIRTGSTSLASLKLYANAYNSNIYPLVIGAPPYKGIEITPATLGKKILTCYCARGLFTNNELQGGTTKLWLEVRTPEIQTDESVHYDVTDSFAKDFVSDISTWSGTTAVTPFKIEVPIEVKELTVPIEVKIYYMWYGASGFVYIDPDIRLVDIVE